MSSWFDLRDSGGVMWGKQFNEMDDLRWYDPWSDEYAESHECDSDEVCFLCGVAGFLTVDVGASENLYLVEECRACGGRREILRSPVQYAPERESHARTVELGEKAQGRVPLSQRSILDCETMNVATFVAANEALADREKVYSVRHVAQRTGVRPHTVDILFKGHSTHLRRQLRLRAADVAPRSSAEWKARCVEEYSALRDRLGRVPLVQDMADQRAPSPLAANVLRRVWGRGALRQLRLAAGPPFPAHGIYGTAQERAFA